MWAIKTQGSFTLLLCLHFGEPQVGWCCFADLPACGLTKDTTVVASLHSVPSSGMWGPTQQGLYSHICSHAHVEGPQHAKGYVVNMPAFGPSYPHALCSHFWFRPHFGPPQQGSGCAPGK